MVIFRFEANVFSYEATLDELWVFQNAQWRAVTDSEFLERVMSYIDGGFGPHVGFDVDGEPFIRQ